MIVEKKPWLESVIDEHFEELQALWSLRFEKATARDWFSVDLAKLDARLAAHADALVLSYPHAQAKFEEHLAGGQEQVFSACLPMLYRPDTDDLLLTHLSAATPENLLGFAYAFCCAPPFVNRRPLHRANAFPPAAADAVALGLASHSLVPIGSEVRQRFESSSDSRPQSIDWIMLAQAADAVIGSEQLQSAWSSDDPLTIDLASQAVIWSRQPWLLDFCRAELEARSPARLCAAHILSMVGDASDWTLIESIILDESLGARRLSLASNAGNPSIIPLICSMMKSEDAPTMIAASQEFTRLTGIDVSTEQLVTLPPETDDEFGNAFSAEELTPDPDLAESAWEKHKDQWGSLTRIHRGQEATDQSPASHTSADLFEQSRAAMRRTFKQNSTRRWLSQVQPSTPWQIFLWSAKAQL